MESQPPREIAKIFVNDYEAIIDEHFGKKETPILDIIGWHILSITQQNNPIKYNQEGSSV